MTPVLRRSACLVLLVAADARSRAEDESLPRGAVTRLEFAAPRTGDEDSDAAEADAGTSRGVEHLALSRDGRALVAARDEGPPVVWDVPSRTARVLPERHRGDITGIAFSPADDDVFASCSDGDDVRLWSLSSGVTLPLPVGRTHGAACGPAFSPDGRWLVAAAAWGAFAYWEIATGKRLLRDGIGRKVDKTGAEFLVAWSPDGALVATAHGDGEVRLVPVDADEEVDAYSVSAESARGLSWSPDGSYVCVVASGRVMLRRRDGEEFARVQANLTSGAHSPAARLVVAGDYHGAVHLLAPPSLEAVATVSAHSGAVRSVAFSGDGRRFATGGADGTILVWDVAALAGAEPEAMKGAAPTGIEPGNRSRRVFPPAELRMGRAEGLLPGERIEPYAGALPGVKIGNDAVRAVLVIDGTTGLPLPGATLLLFEEDIGGPPGPAFARATTDANGIAFAVWEPGRNFGHWLIEREGLSSCLVFGWDGLPSTVVLQSLPDLAGRILDPYGRPVAGGEVELFLGCGHSPAVRRATTADDGLFRMRGCDASGGNLVVLAPGCSAQYLDAGRLGKLGEEPVTFVLRPGADVRGRVIEVDGWPVAGIGVKSGPERTATRTDSGGNFVLRGVAAGDEIELAGPVDIGQILSVGGSGVNWGWPPLPLVITIPPDGAEPENAAGPPVAFDAILVDRDTGAPVQLVGGALVSQASGYRYICEDFDDETQEPGGVRFEAPEGEYLLLPGSTFDSHGADPVPVRVLRDQAAPRIVHVIQQPRLSVRFEGKPPNSGSVEVVAAGEAWELKNLELLGEMRVPANGPAAVVIRDGAMQRAFALGPVEGGRREVVIAWPRPRRILVRGSAGTDVVIDDDLEATKVDEDANAGTCEIETHASGVVRIVLDDDGDGRAIVDAGLPADPGASVEVTVRRVPRTSFVLREAGGAPLGKQIVRYVLWRDGGGTVDETGADRCDSEGRFTLGAATPPCVVELRPESWAPQRVVVRSDGEQPVSWGDATLTVELRDDADRPLGGALCIDGILVDVVKGAAELRGLAPGRHCLLVAAANRQPQSIDLSLGRTATRTIRVVLPGLPY